jgi:Big-like domain-containing protein/galactose oxidase-like protein
MKFWPTGRAISALSVLISLSLFFSCGSGSPSQGPAKLTQIKIAPANQTIAKGTTLQLSATGYYNNGTTQALGASVTWQTSQSAVATINTQGDVTGMGEGVAQLSATYQGVTGSTSITVGPPTLLNITVGLNQSSLPVGESEQLTATGNFSDGTVQNLTQSATWSSSAPGVATITAGGLATGVTAGTSSVSALVGSVTGSTKLTVTASVLVSIAVTPVNASIAAGNTQQFAATGTYSDGSTQNLTSTAAWSSSAPGVATVRAGGLATGVTTGASSLSATMSSITGSATLTVTAPVLVSIAVTPGNASIAVGTTQQFTATGTYSDSSTQNLTSTAAWSSSDSSVATISNASGSQGLATTAGLGATTMQATSGAINGSTTLTVTAGFVLTGTLNTARASHTSTVLTNGMVLIAGGYNGTVLGSAELYNPASGTFTPTGSLKTARLYHTATLLNNGRVLIVGGYDQNGNILASAELYNPATGIFTSTGSLNTARELQTATMIQGTMINGMVLIAGGQGSGGALASAELYNPMTGTFATTGSLNTARLYHTATLLNNGSVNNGSVLIAGGYDNNGNTSATAELYNPATATFTPTLSLNTARYRHTATLLNSGMVLVAGGEDSNGNALASAELYNPATGSFTLDGSLNSARILHTATLLNNGTDLMAGGYGSSAYLTAAELNDPATGTFAPTGSLNIGRYLHTASLLNNGMNLVAGGDNSSGYLASAELYETATLTPPNLVSIALSPSNPTVPLDTGQQLIATGTFSDGSTEQLASVTWSSSNPSAVSITDDASNMGAAYALGGVGGTATVSACAGSVCGSTTVTVGPPALVSIAVAPANGMIPAGESLPFAATGTYSNGSKKDLTSSVTWSSSDPYVAMITAGGVASGWAMGTTSISATVGSVSGTANLIVTPAAVVGLNIAPATLFMSVGSSLQLQAIATLSDGSTRNVNASVAWSLQGAGIATVSSAGVVTADQVGAATIQAQTGGFTASASLTVAPVSALNIIPATLTLAPGTSSQLQAIATLSDGRMQDLTAIIAWSSTQPGIASVSSGGLVTALQVGSTTILAGGDGVTGSVSLTVAPPIALNIVPSPLSMVLGSSSQLQAMATLSDGTTENITGTGTVAWSSAQSGIASVNSGGLATANQVGSTTILAEAGGVTGSVSVTVTPLLLVNYFDAAYAQTSGIEGTVRLTNTGLTGGNLCAMVYVFDQHQVLNECCGCSVSDNGLLTLSLLNDLTANTLSGKLPQAGMIEVVSSDPTQNPQCDPGSLAPTGIIVGWETNPQPDGDGTFQVTERSFTQVPLGGEGTILQNECSYLKQLGSGAGICTCGSGE